jgi:hypothetical protein
VGERGVRDRVDVDCVELGPQDARAVLEVAVFEDRFVVGGAKELLACGTDVDGCQVEEEAKALGDVRQLAIDGQVSGCEGILHRWPTG